MVKLRDGDLVIIVRVRLGINLSQSKVLLNDKNK